MYVSACVTASQVNFLPTSGGPHTHSTSDMVNASRTPPSRGNGRCHGRRVGREELMTKLCEQTRQSITTTTTTTRAAAPPQLHHNHNTTPHQNTPDHRHHTKTHQNTPDHRHHNHSDDSITMPNTTPPRTTPPHTTPLHTTSHVSQNWQGGGNCRKWLPFR